MSNTFVVGYVHGNEIAPQFMDSMLLLINHATRNPGLLGLSKQAGLYVAQSRNLVVHDFLDNHPKADWLFFVDTDMVFEATVPWRLIASAIAQDCKIMSALYFGYVGARAGYQGSNLHPVWFEHYDDKLMGTVRTLHFEHTQELTAGAGMGAIVIHRDVFMRMRVGHVTDWESWFGHDLNYEGLPMGEDVTFCLRARALGFATYGDTRIQVGHVKQRVENLETYLVAESIRQQKEYRIISKPNDPEFETIRKRNGI